MPEEAKDDRLGTSREFEIRGDDRPELAPYGRRGSAATTVLIVIGLVFIFGAVAYLSYWGTGRPTGASVPADGARP